MQPKSLKKVPFAQSFRQHLTNTFALCKHCYGLETFISLEWAQGPLDWHGKSINTKPTIGYVIWLAKEIAFGVYNHGQTIVSSSPRIGQATIWGQLYSLRTLVCKHFLHILPLKATFNIYFVLQQSLPSYFVCPAVGTARKKVWQSRHQILTVMDMVFMALF